MNELYKSMNNILQMLDIFKFEMGKFTYSFYQQNLPKIFESYFSPASNHHKLYYRAATNCKSEYAM